MENIYVEINVLKIYWINWYTSIHTCVLSAISLGNPYESVRWAYRLCSLYDK